MVTMVVQGGPTKSLHYVIWGEIKTDSDNEKFDKRESNTVQIAAFLFLQFTPFARSTASEKYLYTTQLARARRHCESK